MKDYQSTLKFTLNSIPIKNSIYQPTIAVHVVSAVIVHPLYIIYSLNKKGAATQINWMAQTCCPLSILTANLGEFNILWLAPDKH